MLYQSVSALNEEDEEEEEGKEDSGTTGRLLRFCFKVLLALKQETLNTMNACVIIQPV
jgi:hypothetical protein